MSSQHGIQQPLLPSSVSDLAPITYYSRWVTAFGGFAVMLAAGCVYSFGVYSPAFQNDRGCAFTVAQVDWLSFAGNFGNYLPVGGFMYDRLGPRRTTSVGALLIFSGFLLLYLLLRGLVPQSFPLALVGCFLWGHGSGYMDASVVSTSVKNFPQNRGTITAFMKSGYGLATSLTLQYYNAFLFPDQVAFVLFSAAFCGGLGLLAQVVLNFVPPPLSALKEPPGFNPEKQLGRAIMGVVVFGALSLGISLSRDLLPPSDFTHTANYLIAALVTAMVAAFWLVTAATGPRLISLAPNGRAESAPSSLYTPPKWTPSLLSAALASAGSSGPGASRGSSSGAGGGRAPRRTLQPLSAGDLVLLRRIFHHLDCNRNGHLCRYELDAGMAGLGVSHHAVTAASRQVDTNDSLEIDFMQFVAFAELVPQIWNIQLPPEESRPARRQLPLEEAAASAPARSSEEVSSQRNERSGAEEDSQRGKRVSSKEGSRRRAALRRMFRELDTNRGGLLSREQVAAGLLPRTRAAPHSVARWCREAEAASRDSRSTATLDFIQFSKLVETHCPEILSDGPAASSSSASSPSSAPTARAAKARPAAADAPANDSDASSRPEAPEVEGRVRSGSGRRWLDPSVHLREAFARYDADGNGRLDVVEFQLMVADLGILDLCDASQAHHRVQAAFEAADTNGDEWVDYGEFALCFPRLDPQLAPAPAPPGAPAIGAAPQLRSSLPAEAASAAPAAGGPGPGPGRQALQEVVSAPGQTLRQGNFWLLWACFAAGCGAGLTAVNNLALITKSLEGGAEVVDVLVAMYSIFNAYGRLFFGKVSDYCLARYPRPLFLMGVLAVLGCVAFALAWAKLWALYVLLPAVAFLYGGLWSLMPSLTSELFGLQHMGSNYAMMTPAASVGSLLFSTVLFKEVYNAHVHSTAPVSGSKGATTEDCKGLLCFRDSFIVIAVGCWVAAGLAYTLYRRSRHLYAVST